jgi:hypothetical protein
MKLIMIIAAACLTLTAPTVAGYDCSPISGACVPLSSQPSNIDQPTAIVVPQPWPRLCDPDGPRAWDGGQNEPDRENALYDGQRIRHGRCDRHRRRHRTHDVGLAAQAHADCQAARATV